MGAGRTELAMSIFGKSYGKKVNGQLLKNGEEVEFHDVPSAIKQGIAYVSEDRKGNGLILMDDIKQNITLASLDKISNKSIVDKNKEMVIAEEYRKKLKIKTPSIFQKAGNLSGGNQQKIVLSKWIFSEPDILILDEPTRGIDVGAKYEIYSIINDLATAGKGILIISSELPELLGMCDRIYCLNEGSITGEVSKEEANQEKLMTYMTKSKVRG
jgi:putative multiple sugar transport system ATP-binding protein